MANYIQQISRSTRTATVCLKLGFQQLFSASNIITMCERSEHEFSIRKGSQNVQTLDVVQVKKLAKKAKTPCHSTKISLHKKFKLILEQNDSEQVYPKISIRLQKCPLLCCQLHF